MGRIRIHFALRELLRRTRSGSFPAKLAVVGLTPIPCSNKAPVMFGEHNEIAVVLGVGGDPVRTCAAWWVIFCTLIQTLIGC